MTKDSDSIYGSVASEKLEELRKNVGSNNTDLRSIEVEV